MLRASNVMSLTATATGRAFVAALPLERLEHASPAAFDHEGEPAIVITALDHEDRLDSRWTSATARAVREAAAQSTQRLGGESLPLV